MPRAARAALAALTLAIVPPALAPRPAAAQSAEQDLARKAELALQDLYAKTPQAKDLARKAKAVLVFPDVVKAGFVVGGEYGKGVLLRGGEPAGVYNIASGSVGYQIGAQSFSFALMFNSDEALRGFLDSRNGWQLGGAAGVTVADASANGSVDTTTFGSPVVSFTWGNQGLMAGASLQGSKITKAG